MPVCYKIITIKNNKNFAYNINERKKKNQNIKYINSFIFSIGILLPLFF